MKTTLYKANTRGKANHGWLDARHSFSFASYYDPERMGFGLLRVLNDDRISPSAGFNTHPHKDMEIVTIPLRGALRHKDSEGNEAVIRHGEVQLMSAGTGVYHSEFNDSHEEEVNLLQIWVMPEKLRIEPRYDQKKFTAEDRKNKFQTLVSPLDSSSEGVKINQQAYFSIIELEAMKSESYKVNKAGHGVYLFVIDGEVGVAEEILTTRDAIGIEDTQEFSFVAKENSQILLIEVPMA